MPTQDADDVAGPIWTKRQPRQLIEVEKRWLDYARRIVNVDVAHLARCAAAGGLSDPVDPSQALRWPGYLGYSYETARVLLVGQVHRDINAASGVDPAVNDRYVAQTYDWSLGRISDETFLEETRRAYPYWMKDWPGAWRHFRALLNTLELGFEQIAYANLAKCQLPTTRKPDVLLQVCQRDFPMRELVEAIHPTMVLVAAKNAHEGGGTVTDWGTPNVFTFDFRRGTNRNDEKRDVWAAGLIPLLRTYQDNWLKLRITEIAEDPLRYAPMQRLVDKYASVQDQIRRH
jgi:hypothetical protein